jgi:hypothetical protein
MVMKSCILLQYRLPFDLDWLMRQNFANASPKFKRILIDYAASGACDLKNAIKIVASLSPNFNIEPASLKTLLCFFFENEPMDLDSLRITLMPVIRQNFSFQHDFNFIIQPLKKFQKFNHSRDVPRADFSFFVDFLEQQPSFELCLQRNSTVLEAFFLALIHNADFPRTKCLVDCYKFSSSCTEMFLAKFASRIPADKAITLFSSLDIEAKVRVIRSCSSLPAVSQLMINSIAPDESAHHSASLEDGLIKTLHKMTQRKDAKAAVEFLKKINVSNDEISSDVIIVSNDCFCQLLHSTLACVAKTGDIYLAGKIEILFLFAVLVVNPFFTDTLFKKLLSILENCTPERVSTCSTPPMFEVQQLLHANI